MQSMLNLDEQKQVGLLSKEHKGSFTKFKEHVTFGFFAAFERLHHQTKINYNERSLARSRLKEMAFCIVQTLQALSFLFLGRSELSGYSYFDSFWRGLSFTRADIIFAYLGILNALIYVSSILFAMKLIWLSISISMFYAKGTNFKLRIIPHLAKLAFSLSQLLLLPTLSVILAILKGQPSAPHILDAQITASVLLKCLAITLLMGNTAFTVLNELYRTEIRHEFAQFSFIARSTAKAELIYQGMLASIVVGSYVLDEVWPPVQYFISMILSILPTFWFIKWLPYYNQSANFMKAFSCVSVTWWSLVYLISYCLDNSTVCVFLTVVVTPLLYFPLSSLIATRMSYIEDSTLLLHNSYTSLFICELGLRPYIIEHRDNVIELFSMLKRRRGSSTEKMLCIWETYFCLDILEDSQLAKLKFSRRYSCESGVETDFHEFVLKSRLTGHEIEREDISFLRFKDQLSKVKETDEELCSILYQFWADLQCYPLPRVKNYIAQIYGCLKVLNVTYKSLLSEFPTSFTLKLLYGGFLSEIGNNPHKGTAYLHRAEADKRNYEASRSTSQLSFFDDTNGVMIVSGAPDSLGRIMNCNLEAAEILGYTISVLNDLTIDSIIPPPFATSHIDYLKNFIAFSESAELGHTSTLYFLRRNKFIVECTSLIKCSGLLTQPYFVILFKLKSSNCQVAILDVEGKVECHTELFPSYVNILDPHISGYNITTVIPNFLAALANTSQLIAFSVDLQTCKAMHNVIFIKDVPIHLVFLFNNLDEAETWAARQTNEEQIMKRAENSWNSTQKFLRKRTIRRDRNLLDINESKGVTFSDGSTIFNFSSSRLKSESTSLQMSDGSLQKRPSINPQNQAQGDEAGEHAIPSSSSRVESSSSLFSNNSAFSASILGRKLIETVKGAIKLFAICYLVMVVVVLLASIITAVFFQTTVNQQINSLSANDIGKGMHNLAALGVNYRNVQYGVLAGDLDFVETILAEIDDSVISIKETINVLLDEIEDIPEGEFKDCFKKEWITVWEARNGAFYASKLNALDMMQSFIVHVSATQATNLKQLSPANITFFNPDFLFLYKNGLGESVTAMNETMGKFKSVAQARVEALLLGTYICMTVVAIVYFICCAIIVPKIFQIQDKASQVWRSLYAMPKGTLVELRRKALERLRNLHSLDVENEDAGRISKMRKQPLIDPVWRTLMLLLLLFAGISLGFYLYIYLEGLSKTTNLMLERATQMQIIYTHKLSIMNCWFWGAEQIIGLLIPTISITSIQPEWRTFTDPGLSFESAYNTAKYARLTIRSKVLKGELPSSSDIRENLFDVADSDLLELKNGLFTAEFDYLENLKSDLNTIYSANLGALVSIEMEIQRVIDDTTSSFLTEIDDSIRALANQTTGMFIVYCATAIGFYLAITLPVLKWVNSRIRRVWRTASLIPTDVLQTSLLKQSPI